MSAKPTTKKFGKSTRDVPASADKAKKWYNADDESDPKKVSVVGDANANTIFRARKQEDGACAAVKKPSGALLSCSDGTALSWAFLLEWPCRAGPL